jgi:hypothetical protein
LPFTVDVGALYRLLTSHILLGSVHYTAVNASKPVVNPDLEFSLAEKGN